ncbi:hypothetical protein J4727_04915 [Providencia rettgeri]|uniref:Uncharacterized protein n=1 Tax=Providencia rettgeri TaxID=587 RepID=A0A939NF21_PRORE|nr:hypothetical protein [Providencia rettgeri]
MIKYELELSTEERVSYNQPQCARQEFSNEGAVLYHVIDSSEDDSEPDLMTWWKYLFEQIQEEQG